MKILKIITLLIAFALMLSFLPACKSEVSEETKINETTVAETTVAAPETTEETFLEEPEEPEAEEEEEILISGNPELIWAFEHDDLDYDLESIAISPDGETLTVGSYLTTYTHQLYDGQLVDAITTHRHSVNDVAFSPDGLVMGVGLSTYGAVLLNVEDGSELRQLHGGYDNYISFSSDGKHVATGNREGNVWIWNIESGEQIAEFEKPDIGNPGYIWQIDYHPSGDFLSVLYWTD
ncbi:MAG: hypothetical protein PHU65_08665, partial [Actinomycetota bacterium]|nr:hypothetical protein [Actinomycetota bacterium]